MVKMLLCILSAMALAVMTLQLRQQHLELNYKVNRLHRDIESHQAKLWNQQVQIAIYTAPNAIQETVKTQDLKLVPRPKSTTPATPQNGIDPDADVED
jgi:cell division protein FtsL